MLPSCSLHAIPFIMHAALMMRWVGAHLSPTQFLMGWRSLNYTCSSFLLLTVLPGELIVPGVTLERVYEQICWSLQQAYRGVFPKVLAIPGPSLTMNACSCILKLVICAHEHRL